MCSTRKIWSCGATSWLAVALVACGAATPAPTAPSKAEPEPEPAMEPEAEPVSVPANWERVESFTSEPEERAPSPKKGQLVVTSDPEKHGEQLTFSFWVNRVKIEGIFRVPGGGTHTFSLPAGTVELETEECSAGTVGFELAPGESIPLGCELGPSGDCCGVKIPTEAAGPEKKSGGKRSQVKAVEPEATE